VRKGFGTVALAIVVAVLIAGCGGSVISASAAESVLAKGFKNSTGGTATHVSCPSGVDAKVGEKFTCHFTSEGTSYVGYMAVEKIQGTSVYFRYQIYT
jgi:hypothetical protein